MTWNYRVLKKEHHTGEIELSIIEVYYDEMGNIDGWADDIRPHGETLEELRRDLDHMIRALTAPILTADDIDMPGATD